MHFRPSRLHAPLAALAPPRRFDLMLLLLSGVRQSVSQLARAVGLSQSCTTRHLQALAGAGLLKRVRDGKRVLFVPAPRDAAASTVLSSLAGRAASPDPAPPGTPGPAPPRPRRASEPRRPAATPRRDGASLSAPRARRPASREARGKPIGRGHPAPLVAPRAARGRQAARDLPAAAREPATAPREPDSRPQPESGNTSAPAAVSEPAWRRSDIEDFLL